MSQRGDFAMMTDRISSLSFVANMDEADRAKLLSEVRQLLERHPADAWQEDYRDSLPD